jgi:hypothetical protein
VVLVIAASMYRAFLSPFPDQLRLRSFSELQQVVNTLRKESDPVRREDCIMDNDKRIAGSFREIEAMMATNARVFALDMLGPENSGKLGFYYYLTYYLYPREVAISLGQPPAFQLNWVAGDRPASIEAVKQAGYDFVWKLKPDQHMSILTLKSSRAQPEGTMPKRIQARDGLIALLLPLAVALIGGRLVRWLFRDLEGVLSTGERLASGLAVGAFFLTQLTLGLRLAGLRWERTLAAIIMIWAVGEGMLLIRRCHTQRAQFKARDGWWLLLLPAALILWCQFRLAGLIGLQDFDSVAIWAFKAKILHYCAGKELWTSFRNPALAYTHWNYPLLVPLLHALTYGALGHVNEFVSKFWNQWMLLLLAWAVLGAGRFPEKRPWLTGLAAATIVLLPMSREATLLEGAALPMLFYTVLSSLQLAIGMAEQQAGRLRLGLLLLLATAMVRSEALSLLGFWGILLLLDRDSRAALWPLQRLGWAGLLGIAAWLPYVVFRLNGPEPHAESGWASLALTNASAMFHMLPMTWVAMLSSRFLNNEFAAWTSPDNQHAVWQGHWMGWTSLVDAYTQGVGWVCVLSLAVAWSRGGRLRWIVFRLFCVFPAFVTVVSSYWSTVACSPMNYTMALSGSAAATAGRYLYPVLMAWFVAGVVLLLRELPGAIADSNKEERAGRIDPPAARPCRD